MKLLLGKTALVTGASRGIGAASARILGEFGANVGVNFLKDTNSAQNVVKSIENFGSKALAIQADVSNENEVAQMFTKLNQNLGQIDILVISAATSFTHSGFLEQSWDEFENKLKFELKSAFFCVKESIKIMKKKKSGKIIFISSDLSRVPDFGFIAHSTAKSALDGFAKSLAYEFANDGICVNVVAPGLTLTDATKDMPEHLKALQAQKTPMKRNATPEDIAKAVLIFSSDLSSFITGSYTPINGGNLML